MVSAHERPEAVVLFERLTGEVAATLRDVGCAYADATGLRWLPGRPAMAPEGGSDRAVGEAIDAVLADPRGRFALLDLRCGGADRLSGRSLAGLGRAPERLIDDPIGLVDWLSHLHETRTHHSSLRTYLACSDPDEILPYLPYHPKGPDVSLEGLTVRDATIVVAVEAVLTDGAASGGATLVLPGGGIVALGEGTAG